jgi:serine protease Do
VVTDNNHLINLVAMSPIGRPCEVVLWRGRKDRTVQVTIADRDSVISKTAPAPTPVRRTNESSPRRDSRPAPAPGADLGVVLSPLDPAAKARLFGKNAAVSGVLITKVEPTSPFARYLQVEDVIETIGNARVQTPDEALRILKRPSRANPVEIGVDRAANGSREKRNIRIP